jgi:hypothetical protein
MGLTKKEPLDKKAQKPWAETTQDMLDWAPESAIDGNNLAVAEASVMP